MIKELIEQLQKLDMELESSNLKAVDLGLFKTIICGIAKTLDLICANLPDSVGVAKQITCDAGVLLGHICDAMPVEGVES